MEDRTIASDMILVFYLAWMLAFFIGVFNLILGIVIFIVVVMVGMMWSFIGYIRILRYSTRVMVAVAVIRNLYKEPDLRWLTILKKRRVGSLPLEKISLPINEGLDKHKRIERKKKKEEKEKSKEKSEKSEKKVTEAERDNQAKEVDETKDIIDVPQFESINPEDLKKKRELRIERKKQEEESKALKEEKEEKEREGVLKQESKNIEAKVKEKSNKTTLGELIETLFKVSRTGDIYITELILDDKEEEWGKIIVIAEVPFDQLNEAMLSEVSLKNRRTTANAVQLNLFAVMEIQDTVMIYEDGLETDEEKECNTLIAVVTDSDYHSEQIVKGMVDRPVRFVDVKMAVEGYYAYKAIDLAKQNKQLREQLEEEQFLNDQKSIQHIKLANRMLENFGERKEYEKLEKKREPSAMKTVKNVITNQKNFLYIILIIILSILVIIGFVIK